MSRFNKAANKLIGSPLVIPLFLVFLAMFVISIGTSIEDYTTSRLGYMALPTRKANDYVIWLVAAIPQIGQIGFSYAWGREWKTNRKMAAVSLLVAMGLFMVDVGTDMVYKASGQGLEVWVMAFLESALLFTLGSEVMLTVSFGMIVSMGPEFVGQLVAIGHKMSEILDSLDDGGEDDLASPVYEVEEDW